VKEYHLQLQRRFNSGNIIYLLLKTATKVRLPPGNKVVLPAGSFTSRKEITQNTSTPFGMKWTRCPQAEVVRL
jgi:hypothetical protein